MKLVTDRDLIVHVAERWKRQYCQRDGWTRTHSGSSEDTYRGLAALDGKTATAAQVAAIIGNESWSAYYCGECDEYRSRAVALDNGDGTSYICEGCAVRLLALFGSGSTVGRETV